MLNVLFVINDELKIERFGDVFKNNSEYTYAFFSEASEAVDYVSSNPVDIALVSVGLDIINGEELAQIIFDDSPKCLFVFSYEPDEITDAIKLFNVYDYSRIILDEQTEPENIRDILAEYTNFIKGEEVHKANNEAFRKKEMAYKKSMYEMSSILNARIACYSKVIDMFTESSALLFEGNKDESLLSVLDFAKRQLMGYIPIFLDRKLDFGEFYLDLTSRFHNPEVKKYFQLNNSAEPGEDEIFYKAAFIVSLVGNAFDNYMKGYRGKVDITEDKAALKVDILYDVRIGEPDIKAWGYTCRIMEEIIGSFSDKFEYASRNGIFQYRFYFNKSADNTNGEDAK